MELLPYAPNCFGVVGPTRATGLSVRRRGRRPEREGHLLASSEVRFLRGRAHSATRVTEACFEMAARPTVAPSNISARLGRDVRIDYSTVGAVPSLTSGEAVVGQALEIGPDQGFVGRWGAPALAVIELRGQHDDEFAVCLAVRNGPAGPEHDPVARASVAMPLARVAAWRRGLRPASRPTPAVVVRGLRPVPPD